MYEKFREANALAGISKSLKAQQTKDDRGGVNIDTKLSKHAQNNGDKIKKETHDDEPKSIEHDNKRGLGNEEGAGESPKGSMDLHEWYLRQIESNFVQEIETLGGQDENVTSAALLKALTSQISLLDHEEEKVALSASQREKGAPA